MGIITGYIEGIVKFDDAGTPKALPFQDKIEEVTFRYTGESLSVETFSAKGRKGISEACPFRESCSFEISSGNIAWSFLQAATDTLARDAQLNTQITFSYVIQASDITGDSADITLASTPVVGTDIVAADIDGFQYAVSVVGTTATVGDATRPVTAGLKVTITYEEAPSGTNNEIALGSGQSLGEVGVFGRFFGCPDTLLITSQRCIIDANLEFGVGDSPATVAMTLTALRDANENFAVIKRL